MGTVHKLKTARRGKYATLLDPALWDYIDQVNDWYPPEIGELPIAEQRSVYDAMCRAFHQGYPKGVSASDGIIAGDKGHAIPIRYYRMAGKPVRAIVVYYHGGGFVLGGLDSHDDICAEICAGTGFDVVSADYRLAPEHPHPAAFEDALAAFEWAAQTTDLPIVLVGESAGGNLAAAVAHATLKQFTAAERERENFRRQVESIPPERRFLSNPTRTSLAVGAALLDGELAYHQGRHARVGP